MVTAVVLINVRRDAINEVAQALVDLKGVAEVYSVAGDYDLVAIVRVKTNDQLAEVITGQLLKIEGIVNSNTLIAFRAFSRHDLERMFSIGFDE